MKFLKVENRIICAIEKEDTQSDNGMKLPIIDLLIVPSTLRDDLQVCHLGQRIFKSCKYGEKSVMYL